jgi:hypothetical protein
VGVAARLEMSPRIDALAIRIFDQPKLRRSRRPWQEETV